ncbi:MAG: tetratricopeptide repeat protein [Acidobacteriota bacterium]
MGIPKKPPGELDSARDALKSGDTATAARILQALVEKREPAWAEAGFMLAGVLHRSGQVVLARAVLESILHEGPAPHTRSNAERLLKLLPPPEDL